MHNGNHFNNRIMIQIHKMTKWLHKDSCAKMVEGEQGEGVNIRFCCGLLIRLLSISVFFQSVTLE